MSDTDTRIAYAQIALREIFSATRTDVGRDGMPLYDGAFHDALARMIRDEIRIAERERPWWQRFFGVAP